MHSTNSRVMSMPADRPDEVHTLPSTTQRACGCHFTFGTQSETCLYAPLFVVALLPSKTPALPAISEPVHTVMRYLTFGYVVRT